MITGEWKHQVAGGEKRLFAGKLATAVPIAGGGKIRILVLANFKVEFSDGDLLAEYGAAVVGMELAPLLPTAAALRQPKPGPGPVPQARI